MISGRRPLLNKLMPWTKFGSHFSRMDLIRASKINQDNVSNIVLISKHYVWTILYVNIYIYLASNGCDSMWLYSTFFPKLIYKTCVSSFLVLSSNCSIFYGYYGWYHPFRFLPWQPNIVSVVNYSQEGFQLTMLLPDLTSFPKLGETCSLCNS